ncbi:MAG: hypothetical protein M3421_03300 [Bacteroidota bacterium]|jgi:hypothetical protein|nr:hypothetical protein [Bacteroidota bacterium]
MKYKGYYLAAILFLLLGIYRIFYGVYLEATMYFALGIGFYITGIIKNGVYQPRHKLLGVISWIMIFIALFIFLFLLRTDSY